jgi:anti-anti-sigma regulatory factor
MSDQQQMIQMLQEENDRLRHEVQRYHSIIEQLSIGLHIYQLEDLNDDRTLRMVGANPVVEALTGVGPDAIVGKTLDESFPGLREQGVPQAYAEVVRTGTPFEAEQVYGDEHVIENAFAFRTVPLPNQELAVMFENITQRKQTEHALKQANAELEQRLEFDALITRISTNFVNLAAEEIDAGIDQALGEIGTFTDVDRCYVMRFLPDLTIMSNTHEWCAPGITPFIDDLQAIPMEDAAWICEPLLRGDTRYIPSVSNIPDDAANERQELERQGIQSLIAVPMMVQGKTVGLVGFDSVRHETSWTHESIELLRMVGQMIVNALLRREAEQQMREHAAHEQVIAAQQSALRELSTPLIPVSDNVVIMPLIGTIDTGRAQQVMETLLEGVAQHQAELAILDITGVSVVDTQVAQALVSAAQAVRLLGARVMLTGIGPQIAQTLVQLGVDLSSINTRGSLQAGIVAALRDQQLAATTGG